MADFIGGGDDFVDIVGEFEDLRIILRDETEREHFALDKFHQWAPEALAEEENWHFRHLPFLHEDDNLGKLIESAKATREHNVDFRGHGEHNFAGEEILKLKHIGKVGIRLLLVGEGNIETDAAATIFEGAVIGRLHDTRTTTGDDGVTVLDEELAELAGFFTIFTILREAGRAEDSDTLGVGADDFQTFFEIAGVSLGAFDVGGF